jgi:hypothetical protein
VAAGVALALLVSALAGGNAPGAGLPAGGISDRGRAALAEDPGLNTSAPEISGTARSALGGRTEAGHLRPAKRTWERLRETPLVRRILDIGGWIASFLRFVWTIPKALLKGDSQAMIEALGDLLARTSAGGQESPTDESQPPADGRNVGETPAAPVEDPPTRTD